MNNLRQLNTQSYESQTYALIERYRNLDRQIKALTKEKDEIGQELKAGWFLNNDDFIQDGRLIATYKAQIRVSLDQARLKLEMPDVAKEYQKIDEVKVFLLK